MTVNKAACSPKDLSVRARALYPTSGAKAAMQILRPYICPFHRLIELVPQGSSVLDVGCGAGLFLGLLDSTGRAGMGLGFDADPDAIARANKLPLNADIRFEHIDVRSPWPDAVFDVVSMIDVMHHIPASKRQDVISTVASRLETGGLFLYKDMVGFPQWRALANSLHDLLLAREWVQYAPKEEIVSWAGDAGMELIQEENINMLWYGHELCLFRKLG